jgi:4-hydroxy-3-polyprenylbenzoate decarboxylase
MSYKGLIDFINTLDKAGQLVRINQYVNPELEITEITDRVSKQRDGGKALLFENTGTNFPVLINAFGSNERMCMALKKKSLDEIPKEIEDLIKKFTKPQLSFFEKIRLLPELGQLSGLIPKSISSKGACQEIIIKDPDLSIFPILKCWPYDGGRFVTLPIVHTVDPVTGIRNVGMYRMQVFDKNTTGMHWHRHKVGARHFNEYKKQGRLMPVAVALGGDPVYTYSATAPLPDNFDEYLFAGFLRKKKVELVKCITQDIEVPADADIVIEGYVDPNEKLVIEGPFGDHTGFYSLADFYPKFHITCITHKKNAVYPATIVGIPPQEDAYIAKATERIFLTPMKAAIAPELEDIDIPEEGVAHNLTIFSFDKTYPGQAIKIMNSLWGAGQMMFNKILIAVNQIDNIHDYKKMFSQALLNFNPARDTHFSKGPLDVLDHSSTVMAFGGKMGFDLTIKLEEEVEEETKSTKIEINHAEITNYLSSNNKIKNHNSSLLFDKIPLIFLSTDKTINNIQELSKSILNNSLFSFVKILVFIDSEIDFSNINLMVWYAANNIEPGRDTFFIKTKDSSHIIMDGTTKKNGLDSIKRDWPNVVASNDSTINTIDKKWDELGLGKLLTSPSLKFKNLISGESAVNNSFRKKI